MQFKPTSELWFQLSGPSYYAETHGGLLPLYINGRPETLVQQRCYITALQRAGVDK